MLTNTYTIIEAALNLDHSLTEQDKESILVVCRRPRSGPRADSETPARLITMNEVCSLLSVSRTTVWRMMNDGRLHPVRLGSTPRFRLTDLQAIISGVPLEARKDN